MLLKIDTIEAWIRAQNLQTYLVRQAGGIFSTLGYPAGVNADLVRAGGVDKSDPSIKYPNMAVAQYSGSMELLVLEQV